jgi:hypothetical protein
MKKEKEKEKVFVSILKLRNFNWMNYMFLDIIAMLYLDNIAIKANILLLILLE